MKERLATLRIRLCRTFSNERKRSFKSYKNLKMCKARRHQQMLNALWLELERRYPDERVHTRVKVGRFARNFWAKHRRAWQ